MHTGSCLCGAVAFEVIPPLGNVVACHCYQCSKTTGHFSARITVPSRGMQILRDDALAWFHTSDEHVRGFCRQCGSSLFWNVAGEGTMVIAAGALDGPTGVHIVEHWFAGDHDYYSAEGPPPAPSMARTRVEGSCLCGANRFTVPGPIGEVTACHCTQCRKLSGHYSASFDMDEAAVTWVAQEAMGEYVTPRGGVRGFCTNCGSSLWFRLDGSFSIEAGAMGVGAGGTLVRHIHVSSKGDYYELDDGLPQSPGD